jgi:hypothetical protein
MKNTTKYPKVGQTVIVKGFKSPVPDEISKEWIGKKVKVSASPIENIDSHGKDQYCLPGEIIVEGLDYYVWDWKVVPAKRVIKKRRIKFADIKVGDKLKFSDPDKNGNYSWHMIVTDRDNKEIRGYYNAFDIVSGEWVIKNGNVFAELGGDYFTFYKINGRCYAKVHKNAL